MSNTGQESSLPSKAQADILQKSKKGKEKAKYKKINNSTRRQLLDLVTLQQVQLKEASKILNINYSTAKTILRIYRLEQRIEKKNAVEENNLRRILGEEEKEKGQRVEVSKSGTKFN